jgi:hypothetical protein
MWVRAGAAKLKEKRSKRNRVTLETNLSGPVSTQTISHSICHEPYSPRNESTGFAAALKCLSADMSLLAKCNQTIL